VFNFVYQQFIAIYDSGCHICRTSDDTNRVLLCQHIEVLSRR